MAGAMCILCALIAASKAISPTKHNEFGYSRTFCAVRARLTPSACDVMVAAIAAADAVAAITSKVPANA